MVVSYSKPEGDGKRTTQGCKEQVENYEAKVIVSSLW